MEKNKTAIVIGTKSVNAVGLIRSLGKTGINVIFASHHSRLESKFSSEYLYLPSDPQKKIQTLKQFITNQSGKVALFPTDDETAFLLDEHLDELGDICYVPNGNGSLKNKADKFTMSQMAKEAGLRVADFCKIDLSEGMDYPGYPVILKPFIGTSGKKGDIRICHNEQEWDMAIQRFREKKYEIIMCQQFIENPQQYEIGIMGISLPGGKVIIPGMIKKIRSYPSGKGSTSYAQFKKEIPGCNYEAIVQFVKKTQYIGIFDIEMIVSGEEAWFIEINYRNGQYGYTPTVAGYNLPYNWFCGMAGQEVLPVQDIHEIFYMNERDDYLHVKDGEIRKKQWLQEFRQAKAHGMYCKEDPRPYWRQYIKIPDRITIRYKKLKNKIKRYVIKEEWNIAFRPRKNAPLWKREGEEINFTVLKNSFRYWAADPFLVSVEDREYVFFEMYDRFKGKGNIGYREIKNGKVGKMKVAYDYKSHLSFPFIFSVNGIFYMMPESSESQELFLLKAERFPDKWEKIDVLLKGRFVDSILFQWEEDVYLATQQLETGYTFNNLKLYRKDGDNWVAFQNNPIVESSKYARLGGNIIQENGKLIRVAQDCSDAYGKELHFFEITCLDEANYEEQLIASIKVEDVSLNTKKTFYGIHTYNSDNQYEVIDLKRPNRIAWGNVVNLFYLVFKKIIR